MAFKTLLLCFLILSNFVPVALAVSGCDKTGWFGSRCQYQCHCKNDADCDDEGNCEDGCDKGWFGPACQYSDLLKDKQSNDPYPYLYDGDDFTCNNDPNLNGYTVSIESSFHFSWLRVHARSTESLPDLEVVLKTSGGAEYQCEDRKVGVVDDYSVDIHCNIRQTIDIVILSGPAAKDLCTLYISGGRNVALKQRTWQSSTWVGPRTAPYINFDASNAVDGDTTPYVRYHSCSHTALDDPRPSWGVTFTQDVDVFQYLLYNRLDAGGYNRIRLSGFMFRGYDEKGRQVYDHTDQSPGLYDVYSVQDNLPARIRSVVIESQHVENGRKYLTLCEVEIFGEIVCPLGKYGRDCEKSCNCADPTKCLVSTGACANSGIAPAYQGQTFDVECAQGWFGPKCQYQCHCRNTPYCGDEGYCEGPCEQGWFGPGCQYVDLIYTNSVGTFTSYDSYTSTSQPWLKDGVDTTCNTDCNLTMINVDFGDLIGPFTWMRIHVRNLEALQNIDVSFRHDSGDQVYYYDKCKDRKVAKVDLLAMDIYCNVEERKFVEVLLSGSGVKDLCSVYVSGGRNVALKQRTWQSSTFVPPQNAPQINFDASNAVDGDIRQYVESDSCSHTAKDDPTPRWRVTLEEDVEVFMFFLYNRIDDANFLNRLKGFHIRGYDNQDQPVYVYDDNLDSPLKKYTIAHNKPFSVHELEIEADNVDSYGRKYLTLCEVQITGDSVCPHGKYGRDCEKSCNCADTTEQCLVSTGGCFSGCAPGFQGEACDVVS